MSMMSSRKGKAITWWVVGILLLTGAIYGLVKLSNGGTPASTADYPLDTTGAKDWVEGKKDATVVLIEYSDFQCPACGAYYPVLNQMRDQFGDKIAIVYRSYPLTTIHQNALTAARAAEAAGMHGKFWEMHDKLFENQNTWSTLSTPLDTFAGYASQIGLDAATFKKDIDSQKVKDAVDAQIKSGDAARVNGTPTFFLVGKKISPPASEADFAALIDGALKNTPVQQAVAEKVHLHADLRVVVDGAPIDFSQTKYQKTADGKDLNEAVHLHDNGEIVHVHKAGVVLNDLFKSFGMDLEQDCLTIDASTTKCATGANKLRMYVNGKENTDLGSYLIKDIDRLLVLYGSENDAAVQKQITAVPDKACIYSEKCPERGKPPLETDCVGGLGTDCNK